MLTNFMFKFVKQETRNCFSVFLMLFLMPCVVNAKDVNDYRKNVTKPPLSAPGNALNFNGAAGNYVNLGADITNLGKASFTIEAWIKTSATAQGIVSMQNGNGSWETGEKCFYIKADGTPAFVGWGNDYIYSTKTVNDNIWHYVVVTWSYSSGTSGTGKIYIDGADYTSLTYTNYAANFDNISGGVFKIGTPNYWSGEAPNFFTGSIDQVRIYNTALNASEVTSDMSSTTSAKSANLKAYYNFDEGTAGSSNTGITTTIDQSSNGYNGTLANFTLSGSTSNFIESYALVVPTATAATSNLGTSFIANWSAPAVGTVTNYLLDVSTSSTFSSFVSGYNSSNVSGTSKSITGLTSGTTYYYRVRADKTSVTGQGAYSATITVAPISNDATLSALTISSGTLSPAFASATTAYTATVGVSTASITITPTKTNANATIQARVNGGSYGSVTSGSASASLSLNTGSNTIDVLVTAEDGSTTKTYTITVTKSAAAFNALNFDGTNDYVKVANNAALETSVGTVELWARPTWSSGSRGANPGMIGMRSGSGTRYSWHIRNGYDALDLFNGSGVGTITYSFTQNTWYHFAFVYSQSNCTVYINGTNVGTTGRGFSSATGQPLCIGISGDALTSEAFLGNIDEVRIWNIQRTASEISANMNAEVIPSTAGLVAYYRFNQGVANGTNTGLTTANDYTANAYNGTLNNFALSGSTSNWVDGKVTTAQGLPSTNADLSAITLSNGTISPTFASGTTSYTATVSNSTSSITLTPTVADLNSTIQVKVNSGSYTTVANATASSALTLTAGNNSTSTITVLVTAQDGTTTKTYTITVTKAVSTDATLASLSLSSGSLTSFASATTAYTVNYYKNTTSITVTPTKNDAGATIQVRVNGGSYATVTSGSASGSLSLSIGNNTIDIKVTAEDGTTTKTYTITANRSNTSGVSNALNFDGSNDYAVAPVSAVGLTSFTIEMYIKPTSSQSGVGVFQWANTLSGTNPMILFQQSGSTIKSYENGNYNLTGNITVGSWNHVALTYDGTVYTLYINGAVAQTYTGAIAFQSSSTSIYLGNGYNGYWSGSMDEVRIWSTARTQAQIKANMDLELAGNETGLLAYYNFNQGTPGAANTGLTSATDGTSNAKNATLTNFALSGSTSNWVTGYVNSSNNNALSFDGSNDYVSTGISVANNTSYTIEFLLNPTSITSGGDERIISSSTGGTSSLGLRFQNGKIEAWDGAAWFPVTTSTIPLNTWTHFALTCNTSGQLIGYVNGVAEVTITRSSTFWSNIILGQNYQNTYGSYYYGLLDEFRYWTTTRTQAQIQANRGVELVGNEAGLQTYYKFNQGNAADNNTGLTSLIDVTGNGKTGTLTNFALTGSTSNWVSGNICPVISASISGTATICATNSTNVAVAITGGTSPYSVVYTGGTVTNYTSGANISVSPSTTTTYTITSVTDAAGCASSSNSGSAIVTVTPTNTAGVASSTPSINLNSSLTTITHTTTGASGIGTATGLPAGVSSNWASNTISITGTPTQLGTFNYSIPLTGGCGSINATGTITVSLASGSYLWTGNVSSDWTNAQNWNPTTIPGTTSNIIVNTVTAKPYPVITGNVTVNNISIATGATLALGSSLTVNGAISGTGYLKGGLNSNLSIKGSGATTLYFNQAGTDSLLNNLEVNGTGSVSLGNKLGVAGTLSLTNGTLNTNDRLVLKSLSINKTGIVDVFNSSFTLTGNVTVERFIPKGLRTFRDLGLGVYSNTGTIFSNWQEGGVNNNGYGISITGVKGVSTGYDNATGFDYSLTGNPSLYKYTNNAWSTVASTKVSLDPYKGYRVLVRGDRSVNLFPASVSVQPTIMISNATLRTTGKLITGDVTYGVGSVTNAVANSTYGLTAGASSYSFVANPYIAPVDWEAVWNNGTTNLNATYWYNDPTGTTDGTSNGYTKFVSYSASLHTASNPLGTSNVGRYLQPGQAFFVQNATTGAQLVFKEAYKAVAQTKTAIFGAAAINRLAIALYKAGENLDGAVSVFGNYSKAAGIEDAVKFSNSEENIAFTVGSTDLAINGYSAPTKSDVLPIHIYQLKANTAYTLRLDVSQFAGNGVMAFVKDNVTNTTTPLSGDNTTLSFATSATDAASFANRYSVVFAPSALPVSGIVASAVAKGTNVLVNWNTVGEKNLASYTVERSFNGVSFASVITKSAANAAKANYSFTDATAQNGTNYYRIKATDKSGNTSFSAVVAVTLVSGNKSIGVYPNPVVGSSFGLKLANFETGKYAVSVYNSLGQKLVATSVAHAAGNTTEQVNLNSHLATGMYTVRVAGLTGKVYETQLIIK